MTRIVRLVCIVIAFGLSVAEAAHITDKLLAGLYEKPASGQKPLKLLPSGTQVEVLGKKSGYQRVKLIDGTLGWVNASYITDEQPAQAKLLAAEAKIAELQKQLASAEAQPCDSEETGHSSTGVESGDKDAAEPPADSLGPVDNVASPDGGCASIEAELIAAQDRMIEAGRILGLSTEGESVSMPRTLMWLPAYWPWLAIAAALAVGLLLGVLLVQRRITKRFGKGFRL